MEKQTLKQITDMRQHLLFRRLLSTLLLLAVTTLSWAESMTMNGCDIWSSAIELVGLNSELSNTHDSHWDVIASRYSNKSIYSGAQWDYCLVPEKKLIGHTLFVLSDETLSSKYGITSLQGLYDKARALYGGEALSVSSAGNADKFRQSTNPLYRLIAYHILKGKADYDHLTTITTIETTMTNPTEWYGTMYDGKLLKVEQITRESDISALGLGISTTEAIKGKKQLFLNHSTEKNVRGAKVIRPDEDGIEENVGQNYCIYELDALVDYTSETQQAVFNTVMRIDLYTMFPELMTNGIRSDKTNEGMAMSNSKDALCKNYWFPKGYIKGFTVNDEATLCYEGPHNTYWSYEGDEFLIVSNTRNYDVKMEIPPLPEGEYQIRLGFANMYTRGIFQFLFDGKPIGLSIDMTSFNFVERTGWTDIYNSDGTYRYDEETTATILKNMHAKGWYHGPEDVFSISGEGHEDGDPTVGKNYFSRNSRTSRYVLGNQPIQITGDDKIHTIQFKSVDVTNGAVLQLDYLDLVPQSEWGDWEPVGEKSYDFAVNGMYFKKIDEGTVKMTFGEELYTADILIPSTVTYEGTTYDVTAIDSYAFYGCSALTSITIPENITKIGNDAFYGCPSLTTVTLNSNVAGSYGRVFGPQVKEYIIGENVTGVGGTAFYGCSSLTSVKVNSGNAVFDSRNNCNAIIETASNTLIAGCKTTIIPESVTSIGNSAFYGCSGLTSITIPESVTSIGEYAFAGCSGLTTVTIPESVTTIGYYAFEGCSGLTSITIPESVTNIGNGVFYNSSGLTSVTIPNSVTTIGEYAFAGCSGLTSVTIPNSVTSIGYGAFSGCTGLPVEGGLRYADTYLVEAVDMTLTTCDIKERTKWIGSSAFSYCTGLTSISIPESVTSIGRDAFRGCTGLTSVNIGSGVRSIGTGAFSGCYGINTVTLNSPSIASSSVLSNYFGAQVKEYIFGSEVTHIGLHALSDNTELKSVTIHNSIWRSWGIGDYAFSGCTGLTSVTFLAPTTDADTKAAPQTAYTWWSAIGDYAFSGCTSLTSIAIPSGVRSIGKNAFDGCTELSAISIPESVTNIGDNAFSECTSLPVEGGLRYADTYLVKAVDQTRSTYSIKDGTRWIGNDAFSSCVAMTELDIPESVTGICSSAFISCSALTKVTIPEKVRTIDKEAFNNCRSLMSVTCKVTSSDVSTDGLVPPTEPTIEEPTVPEPGIEPSEVTWLLPFNPAHPVEEATMQNYQEVDDTDPYNKVYPEEECRAKWQEYFQAVKDNLGTAARRLNVTQQVTRQMNLFGDADNYMKRNGELVNKTQFTNEWAAYYTSLEEYRAAWETYYADKAYYELMSQYETVPVPVTASTAFVNAPQSDATLYVYSSVIDAYKATEPWSLFGTILPIDEEDPSAVETLPAQGENLAADGTGADAPIYDLMGRRLSEKPTSGMYIQGGRKYVVK